MAKHRLWGPLHNTAIAPNERGLYSSGAYSEGREGQVVLLHIILVLGAVSTGALALMIVLSIHLLEKSIEEENEGWKAVISASVKRRKRAMAVLGVASALFVVAFILI